MKKKLLFPLIIMVSLMTSCNKGFNAAHGDGSPTKKVAFNVINAPVAYKLTFFIGRFSYTEQATLQIDNINFEVRHDPYSFASVNKAQKGDSVSLQVTGYDTQPVNVVLSVDDVNIPATAEGINPVTKQYYKIWDFTIQ